MQTQNDQIGLRHQIALGGDVFAQLGRDAEHLDLRHGGEALTNLQPCGASFAVDKNFKTAHREFVTEKRQKSI